MNNFEKIKQILRDNKVEVIDISDDCKNVFSENIERTPTKEEYEEYLRHGKICLDNIKLLLNTLEEDLNDKNDYDTKGYAAWILSGLNIHSHELVKYVIAEQMKKLKR